MTDCHSVKSSLCQPHFRHSNDQHPPPPARSAWSKATAFSRFVINLILPFLIEKGFSVDRFIFTSRFLCSFLVILVLPHTGQQFPSPCSSIGIFSVMDSSLPLSCNHHALYLKRPALTVPFPLSVVSARHHNSFVSSVPAPYYVFHCRPYGSTGIPRSSPLRDIPCISPW